MDRSPGSLRRWLLALTAGVALAAGCAVPAFGLDFQLHTVSLSEDGFVHRHSCFKYDERSNVLIDLPPGWNTTADAGSITSSPPNAINTFILLQRSPLTPGTPFRDSTLDTYRQRALASVPPGSSNIRVVKETPNPLPIFGWQDFEFEMSYDLAGTTFHRSVLFINLDTRQQILTAVVAEASAFDKIHAAAMDVLRSWHPTLPSY